MATDTGTIFKGDIAISGQYWRRFLHSQEGRRPKTALLRNSCWCFLFLSFDSFFFSLNLLIPNRFQSPVFSSNSLESLELLMPARKHILLRSEEYLCSVSNTNRRRFKYCSSGVCLCGCVRERERKREFECAVCICVSSRDWLRIRKDEKLCERVCMCVCHYVCSQRVFLFLVWSTVKVNNRQCCTAPYAAWYYRTSTKGRLQLCSGIWNLTSVFGKSPTF